MSETEVSTKDIEINDLAVSWNGFLLITKHADVKSKWEESGEGSAIFWTKYPDHKNILVMRTQTNGGFCHMNAAIVLQHILVTINNSPSDQNVGMFDIDASLDHLSDTKLQKFILKSLKDGGQSDTFLCKVCGLGERDLERFTIPNVDRSHSWADHNRECAWIMDLLRDEGPALISSFRCHPDFIRGVNDGQENSVVFNGIAGASESDQWDYKSLHSMLLVGYAL